VDAVIRETLEETAWQFTPTALIGIYQHHQTSSEISYLRFAFTGDLSNHQPQRTLDDGILRALWMPVAEIRANSAKHRTPLLMQCVDDYLTGLRYPLQLLHHYD
jgi:8-oxo-dGTP pyrophosphatase MutT (NUDIX family)